jgi:hypothetical protein
MKCASIADEIANHLEPLIQRLPEGFFGSFEFTQTGKNLTHPTTLGALSRVLWGLDGVAHVGVDVRLNLGGGVKFQPDLVAMDAKLNPVVAIDYESPNSSDARIPVKDVDAYLAWHRESGIDLPYVIVTTLPDCAASAWELRYTAPGFYNVHFRGRGADICRNPFRFWSQYYIDEFAKREVKYIALLNINGNSVRRCYPA